MGKVRYLGKACTYIVEVSEKNKKKKKGAPKLSCFYTATIPYLLALVKQADIHISMPNGDKHIPPLQLYIYIPAFLLCHTSVGVTTFEPY